MRSKHDSREGDGAGVARKKDSPTEDDLDFFEEMPDGLLLIDPNAGQLVASNRVAREALGYSREEMRGLSLQELIPDEDEEGRKRLIDVMNRSDSLTLEVELRRKDSTGMRSLITAKMINARGKDRILAVFKDITGLREMEDRLSSIFNNALIGLYRTTPEGKILLANPALVRMLGYTSFEDLSTRNLNAEGFFIDEPRDFFLSQIDQMGHVVGMESRWKRRDGSIIYVRDCATAVKDKQGHTLYYEGTVEDITERKLMQERISREKVFAETIIETAGSLFVGLDADGKIALFNREAEELTGWPRSRAMGEDWFSNFVAPGSRETSRSVFLKAMKDEESEWTERVLTNKGEITVLWHNALVTRDYRQVVINIGVDISERERYKSEMQALNESLKVLNTILRHDISSDLMIASGCLELYQGSKEDRLLEAAASSLRKCSELLKRMKELESIISTNELKPLSARKVASEVVGHFAPDPVKIELEGDCLVRADEALGPALNNLIRNAIIHGGTDRIQVKMAREPGSGKGLVAIIDEGRGIPDDVKHLVFQEGFRYGDTGNTGLGLYIVKKTMERYGGEVQLEDNTPHGCIFTLRFPSPEAQARNIIEI